MKTETQTWQVKYAYVDKRGEIVIGCMSVRAPTQAIACGEVRNLNLGMGGAGKVEMLTCTPVPSAFLDLQND